MTPLRPTALLLLVTAAVVFGQAPLKPDYSQEATVTESARLDVFLADDGTSERKATARIRVQSEAGVQRNSVIPFSYQSSSETLDIDFFRVRKPDGKVIVTPPESIQETAAEITQTAPMYSDLREKHIAVKGLGVGDVIEYQIRWKVTKPLVPGQFWVAYTFPDQGITEQKTFQVNLPSARAVKYVSAKSQPSIVEEGGRRIYTWTRANLTNKTADELKKQQEVATYQAQRGKFPQPEILLSTFQDWGEVGKWYGDLQRERAQPTPEVTAKALELTKGLTDPRAKVQAIYDYVSTRIHYIGISFGIGRYQPHSAAEVLANQYGDCKDKHTLFAALAAAVGVSASPVLLATRNDFEPGAPTPGQFDHVISAVRIGEQTIFVDTTPGVAPFGYLFGAMRDKKALLVSPAGPSLMTIPANAPIAATETFRFNGKISDSGTLEGAIERAMRGTDTEVLARAAYRATPVVQWKELTQQLSRDSGFAGDVDAVSISSPEKTDEPFRISYKYVRKEFPGWSDRQLQAALPPLWLAAVLEAEQTPATPVWMGSPVEFRYESRVELPAGYRPILVKDLDLVEEFGEYHRTQAWERGAVLTERRLFVRKPEVAVERYPTFRKFNQTLVEEYTARVALQTAKWELEAFQEEIWALPMSENQEANRAYDEAREKAKTAGPHGVIAALQPAVQADPKFARAWLWLGENYQAVGEREKAIDAYRKAVAADPEQPVCLRGLGAVLLTTKRFAEAVPVWQKLIKRYPKDPAGPQGLGLSYRGLNRTAEAIAALEQAAALNPRASEVQGQLATVYLGLDKRDQALEAYQKAADLEPSPMVFNEVAYAMAEANRKLDVALEYAKRAVAETATASRKVTFPEFGPNDFAPTHTLRACWDTLGWVYFKRGNFSEAETYLEAAWLLGRGPAVALHLGQTYEKNGNTSRAARIYRIVLEERSLSPLEDAQTLDEIRARLKKLASGKTADEGEKQAREDLLRMQMKKLEMRVPGHVNFALLFRRDPKTSAAVVEDVKLSGDPEHAAEIKAALKSVDFQLKIPGAEDARFIRLGFTVCEPGSGCHAFLMPPIAPPRSN